MRGEQEVNRALDRYADTVRRLCMIHLKSYADTEDIFQTVFLKYALRTASFESDAHEKAWFIRVTINACKDLIKSFFRSRSVSMEEIPELPADMEEEHREVLEAVLSLPEKYRQVVYLHYYEGYTAPQIARILKRNVNTVYTLLTRSRQMLREKLGGEAMNDRIREAFDQVHAEENLKVGARAFLTRKTRGYRRWSIGRRLLPIFACLLLLLAGWGGYRLYFTPTSLISIDINPSMELEVNRFDRVIAVRGYNPDGEALASSMNVKYLDYAEAVERVLDDPRVGEYLSGDAILSIVVAGRTSDRARRSFPRSARARRAAAMRIAMRRILNRWPRPTRMGFPAASTACFWRRRRWIRICRFRTCRE